MFALSACTSHCQQMSPFVMMWSAHCERGAVTPWGRTCARYNSNLPLYVGSVGRVFLFTKCQRQRERPAGNPGHVLLCSDVSLAAHNVISLQRDLGGMWDRERPFL